jgi:hypothetical protein
MPHRKIILVSALALAVGAGARQASTIGFDGSSWWGYVKVLADDNMEGRETGSEGLRRAESYTVEQLQKYGLEPGGENGFYPGPGRLLFEHRRLAFGRSYSPFGVYRLRVESP